MGNKGRIVIPAPLRQHKGWADRTHLIVVEVEVEVEVVVEVEAGALLARTRRSSVTRQEARMCGPSGTHSVIVEVDFPVARERVFDAWINPDLVTQWFAPPGFTITACVLPGVPGTPWHIEYEDPHAHAYSERGVGQTADAPESVTFTLTQVDGTFVGPETLVEVALEGDDGHTRMRFEQSGFPSAALRDVNEEGWRECFGKLGEVLGGSTG